VSYKNNKHTIRRGGKFFRLFLLLTVLPNFLFAQFELHFANGSVLIDAANNAMHFEIDATVKNLGEEKIDSLTWVFWPNAYTDKSSALAIEFLEDQNGSLHFAKDQSLGTSALSWSFTDKNQEFEINQNKVKSEVFKIAVSLNSNQEKTIHFSFDGVLPDAKFNGFGVNAQGVFLSHWLPELAADQNYPVTNSRNRGSWIVPATYSFELQSNIPLHCFSNLKVVEKDAKQKWLFSNNSLSRDALIMLVKKSTTFEMNVDEAALSLHFSGDFPPFNQLASWQQIAGFLKSELNYVPLENPHFFFSQNKGLQSAGNLYLLSETTKQDELEAAIVEQIVHVIAREKLNINPEKHPWLVEGLANYYKHLYIQKYYPDKKLLGPFAETKIARLFDIDHYPIRYQNRMLYLYMNRQGLDQPLSDPSSAFPRANREAVIKGKSALFFSYVRNYTSERNFKRSMHYWLQQAPEESNPEDFLEAIRYYHNQNVDWVLGDLYGTNKKLDYKLKRTENCSSVYTATVKNKGDLLVPFPITGYKEGKPLLTEWFVGHPKKKTVQIHLEDYSEVKIDGQESMPEYTQKNNTVRTSGVFKQFQPLKLQFYTSFENPNKTQLFWLPSLKYNAYDQFLIGAQFYNTNLFRKPFEYKFSPEYSTGTGQLTGAASTRFNWTPHSSLFHLISFGVYAKYYHYAADLAYFRLSPTLTFNFKKSSPRSEWIRTLRLRTVSVDREEPQPGSDIIPTGEPANYQVLDLQYKAEKGSLLNPFIGIADVQFNTDFVKLSGEVKQR